MSHIPSPSPPRRTQRQTGGPSSEATPSKGRLVVSQVVSHVVSFFRSLVAAVSSRLGLSRQQATWLVSGVLVLVIFAAFSASCRGTASQDAPSDSATQGTAQSSDAGEVVSNTYGTHSITVTGDENFPQSDAFAQLDDAVGTFESTGSAVGFVLVDLDTGKGVSYHDERLFYPASSVKAPYVTALFENVFDSSGLSPLVEDTCRQCIVESDNECYQDLRTSYDVSVFTDWLDDNHIPYNESEYGFFLYPNTSASQLEAMWKAIYSYVSSGKGNSSTLRSFLSETNTSSLRAVLGSKYEVLAKAGWYPNEFGDASTCEGGIVYSDTGTYVVAVMSNAPEDFESMEWLVDAINRAHAGLTGGDTSSSITSDTMLTSGEGESVRLIGSSPADEDAEPADGSDPAQES